MSFNGSGVYVLPGANYPAVSGTAITAANRNAVDSDIADALSNCITKDGQSTPTGNIPMAGFKITGIAAATTIGDALSYGRAATVTTLAASGNVNVNGTKFGVTASTGTFSSEGQGIIGGTAAVLNGQVTSVFDGATRNGIVLNDTTASAALGFARFALSGVDIGSITRNAATSAVLYNTTSDYRIKVTFGEFTDARDVLAAIPVHEGSYVGDDHRQPLLIAHEVAEVMPWAVTGDKDAVDPHDRPIYQQMNYMAFVPLLVSEVKALRAEVEALKAR